jgi:hypothetical protein
MELEVVMAGHGNLVGLLTQSRARSRIGDRTEHFMVLVLASLFLLWDCFEGVVKGSLNTVAVECKGHELF